MGASASGCILCGHTGSHFIVTYRDFIVTSGDLRDLGPAGHWPATTRGAWSYGPPQRRQYWVETHRFGRYLYTLSEGINLANKGPLFAYMRPPRRLHGIITKIFAHTTIPQQHIPQSLSSSWTNSSLYSPYHPSSTHVPGRWTASSPTYLLIKSIAIMVDQRSTA